MSKTEINTQAKAIKPLPSLDELRRAFKLDAYSPSGLSWLVSRGSRVSGAMAGCRKTHGMYWVKFNRGVYAVHRIVWSLANGALISPDLEIDHANRNPSDNRPANLRACTTAQNGQNRSQRENKTGFAGVYQERGRWGAKIKLNGQMIWLGYYNTPEEAHAGYIAGKAKHHTFNPNIRAAPPQDKLPQDFDEQQGGKGEGA